MTKIYALAIPCLLLTAPIGSSLKAHTPSFQLGGPFAFNQDNQFFNFKDFGLLSKALPTGNTPGHPGRNSSNPGRALAEEEIEERNAIIRQSAQGRSHTRRFQAICPTCGWRSTVCNSSGGATVYGSAHQ